MIRPSITLVPSPPCDEGLLQFLVDPLQREFQAAVTIEERILDPSFAYDLSRSQYNSTSIIEALLTRYPQPEGKLIAVTGVDLFVPILTYVFGEAQLDGPMAVVSSWRLDNELYGLPADRANLESRMLKEAVHELGHTFGLYHCRNFECVMRSSTTADEIDLKLATFCEQCKEMIRERTAASM